MFSSPVNPELQRLPAAEVTVLMMSHPVQHRSSGLCTRTTHAMRDKLRTVPGSFAFPVKKARFPRAAFPVFKIPKAVKGDKLTQTVELDNLSSPSSQTRS